MLCPFTLCICALLRPSCALAGHGKISWYRGEPLSMNKLLGWSPRLFPRSLNIAAHSIISFDVVRPPTRMTELSLIREALDSGGYRGICWEPWWCVVCLLSCATKHLPIVHTEIVMVRLQGDFAKPPEKRFNYKNCFDALFRVRLRLCLSTICVVILLY
jgi:hypothetical protein